MRKAILTGAAGFVLALGVAGTGALAMGGMGGPSDAWGSPWALYAPQTFQAPPGWGPLERRAVSEGQSRAAPTGPASGECGGSRPGRRNSRFRGEVWLRRIVAFVTARRRSAALCNERICSGRISPC